MAGAKRGRLEALIYIASNWQATFTDSVGATVVTVAAGNWYILDLIAEINADLPRNWLVTISDGETGTGRVTITTTDTPWSVTWTSTDMRDLLGFTGNIAGVSVAQTGTNHVQGMWLPDTIKWSPHGDDAGSDNVLTTWTDTRYLVGPQGQVQTLGGNSRKEYALRYEGCTRARTKVAGESVSGESFEQFWLTCHCGGESYFKRGAAVRVYWDADDDTNYTVVKMILPPQFDPGQLSQNWTGRYVIEIPRIILVPS